jgi:hypothetical protein
MSVFHRLLPAVVVSLLTMWPLGCTYDRPKATGPMGQPVSSDSPAEDAAKIPRASVFHFAIVGDRTGGCRPGVFASAINRIDALQPDFVMSVGDLIEGYTADGARLDQQWNEVETIVSQLDVPFFYVAGNHDISDQQSAAEFRARYGEPYYAFRYRDVLFLCLNTEEAGPERLGDVQVAWAKDVLRRHGGARWTMVFMHKPLWVYERRGVEEPTGWTGIEPLLAGRPHHVFAGHFHGYAHERRLGGEYFILATTGGASELTGPTRGKFDHIVWVAMTEQGPRLTNLMLDGMFGSDVKQQAIERTKHVSTDVESESTAANQSGLSSD